MIIGLLVFTYDVNVHRDKWRRTLRVWLFAGLCRTSIEPTIAATELLRHQRAATKTTVIKSSDHQPRPRYECKQIHQKKTNVNKQQGKNKGKENPRKCKQQQTNTSKCEEHPSKTLKKPNTKCKEIQALARTNHAENNIKYNKTQDWTLGVTACDVPLFPFDGPDYMKTMWILCGSCKDKLGKTRKPQAKTCKCK